MGKNSKMRNLLTYFPIEPTKAYPVPRPLTVMLTLLKPLAYLLPCKTYTFASQMSLALLKPIF